MNHNHGTMLEDFGFLNNPSFVGRLNQLRHDFTDEVDYYSEYFAKHIISRETFGERIENVVKIYDQKFLELWNSLSFEDRIKILSRSNSFMAQAEKFASPEEITTARIIK